MNKEGYTIYGEKQRPLMSVSVSFPEMLLKIDALRNLFFIPVFSGHLTFEVETSTRSQNVQQTPVTSHIISAQ